MKTYLSLLTLLFTSLVFGQVPSVKGVDQTTKNYPVNITTPYSQVTKTNGSTVLLETGNTNYLPNAGFEGVTHNYNTYVDTAGVAPVDGTGGTADSTFDASTSSPLRGLKSGLFSKPASNEQGEGFSTDFTIDSADQTKIVDISFDYETSANYVDGDIRIYVYDITNSKVIELVNRDLMANANGTYRGFFQASPDSVSFRLIGHIASTNALAYTVKLDDVKVAPQGAFDSCGGNLADDAFISQVIFTSQTIAPRGFISAMNTTIGKETSSASFSGANYKKLYEVLWTQPGLTTTAGHPYRISSAKGASAQADWDANKTITIDFATNEVFVRAKGSARNLGSYQADLYASHSHIYGNKSPSGNILGYPVPNGNLHGDPAWFNWNDTTSTLASGGTETRPKNVALNAYIRYASYGASEDAGNREIVAKAYLPTNQSIPHNSSTTLNLSSVSFDSSSSVDTSLYRVNIKESGKYDLATSVRFAPNTSGRRLSSVNRVRGGVSETILLAQIPASSVAAAIVLPAATVVELKKDDYIELKVFQDSGGALLVEAGEVQTFLSIAKRSSPQTIAASETVAVRATQSSEQSISNSTIDTLLWNSKNYDYRNSLNLSNGQVKIPVSGLYRISASVQFQQAAYSIGNITYLAFARNGSVASYGKLTTAQTTTVIALGASHSDEIYLNRDEILTIVVRNNRTGGSTALDPTALTNYFSIIRVGN